MNIFDRVKTAAENAFGKTPKEPPFINERKISYPSWLTPEMARICLAVIENPPLKYLPETDLDYLATLVYMDRKEDQEVTPITPKL